MGKEALTVLFFNGFRTLLGGELMSGEQASQQLQELKKKHPATGMAR